MKKYIMSNAKKLTILNQFSFKLNVFIHKLLNYHCDLQVYFGIKLFYKCSLCE